MDIRILGPIEVRRDGSPVALSRGRQRALLALLNPLSATGSCRPIA